MGREGGLGGNGDQQRKLEVVEETGFPYLQFPILERGADKLERCLERGRALGLIEVFERPNALPTYQVPRLLAGLVVLPGDGEVLAKVGAEVLHRLWWESDYQYSEEQALEIHRLALVGKAGEIAVKIAYPTAVQWINKSRFWDAVKICQETLNIIKYYRIFHQLARALQVLGDINQSEYYYQQSLETCPSENEIYKSIILHNLAGIKKNQGKIEEAMNLYQLCLKNFEKSGDTQLMSIVLNQLAQLEYDQEEIDEAITVYQQLGEVHEETGDLRSQAANFHQLAHYYAKRDTKKAKKLFHQSFIINDSIGNMRGKAYNLEGLARICAKEEGQIQESITLYKQSLEMANYIRDMALQASILAMMGQLLADNA
jgi:tetratricopeptide (TPR) repeat protein